MRRRVLSCHSPWNLSWKGQRALSGMFCLFSEEYEARSGPEFFATIFAPFFATKPVGTTIKTSKDHKTHFETVSLPVAEILLHVARQAPTKFINPCNRNPPKQMLKVQDSPELPQKRLSFCFQELSFSLGSLLSGNLGSGEGGGFVFFPFCFLGAFGTFCSGVP